MIISEYFQHGGTQVARGEVSPEADFKKVFLAFRQRKKIKKELGKCF